eukprot:6499040-Prymnesium_polylepis.1
MPTALRLWPLRWGIAPRVHRSPSHTRYVCDVQHTTTTPLHEGRQPQTSPEPSNSNPGPFEQYPFEVVEAVHVE